MCGTVSAITWCDLITWPAPSPWDRLTDEWKQIARRNKTTPYICSCLTRVTCNVGKRSWTLSWSPHSGDSFHTQIPHPVMCDPVTRKSESHTDSTISASAPWISQRRGKQSPWLKVMVTCGIPERASRGPGVRRGLRPLELSQKLDSGIHRPILFFKST